MVGSVSTKYRTSRANGCVFECVLKLDKKENTWRLRLNRASQNLGPGNGRVAHATHQVAALTSQVEETIIAQSTNPATPANIVYGLNQGLEEDPIWKTRDVYNAKHKVCHQ